MGPQSAGHRTAHGKAAQFSDAGHAHESARRLAAGRAVSGVCASATIVANAMSKAVSVRYEIRASPEDRQDRGLSTRKEDDERELVPLPSTVAPIVPVLHRPSIRVRPGRRKIGFHLLDDVRSDRRDVGGLGWIGSRDCRARAARPS